MPHSPRLDTPAFLTLRALLFMPGDDRRKIDKAAALNADAVILDLEDGVALNRKAAARETIAAALNQVDFGRAVRIVRINAVSTPFWQDDLAALHAAPPDAIMLPKTESAAHIAAVVQAVPDLPLLAIIESGTGVLALNEIATADARLAGLVFGAEDYAGDIGATRTPGGEEVLYARSAVVLHAKARRLAAIDTPFVDLHDLDGLRSDTERAHRLGYTGKLAIHPRQIEPIQQVFTPTAKEISAALRLMEAHEQHQRAGSGVFAFDGKMVDMPIVRAAETIIARARAAGLNVNVAESESSSPISN
jgi:citrate lyase beta subunit